MQKQRFYPNVQDMNIVNAKCSGYERDFLPFYTYNEGMENQ